MAAGRAAGAETILLGTDMQGLDGDLAGDPDARPDHVVGNLATAFGIIESRREASVR